MNGSALEARVSRLEQSRYREDAELRAEMAAIRDDMRALRKTFAEESTRLYALTTEVLVELKKSKGESHGI